MLNWVFGYRNSIIVLQMDPLGMGPIFAEFLAPATLSPNSNPKTLKP